MNPLKRVFKKYENSIMGYLPVKIVEGLVLMLTLKIYVVLFTTAQFGDYSLYNKTVSLIYLFFMGWIGMASFRYVRAYADQGDKKDQFYSTVFISFMTLTLVVVGVSGLLQTIFPNWLYGGWKTFAAMVVLLFGYGLNQLFITLLLYQDQQRLNMLLILLAAPLKLLFTYVLYRATEGQMISILLSHGLVDTVFGLIAIHRLKVFSHISLKAVDRGIIKGFVSYGYPLMGLSLMMFLLNSSDQYMITGFIGRTENGIYAGNYTVASSIFTMITMGLNRGVYPKALSFWQKGDHVNAKKTVSQGFKFFLLIATPAATGLMLVSEYISKLFLEPAYVEGNIIIGIIAFSMVFYGMSEYMNKGHELKGYTVPIFVHCFIAAIVNVVLNFLLIPIYGYMVAALTTLIGFMTYFVLSYVRKDKGFIWSIPTLDIVKIFLANAMMYILAKAVMTQLSTKVFSLVLIMALAALIYGLVILLTGVLREEIQTLKAKRG